jgi:O-acetyl-ADP-ribose deacetylase (regulator of RNase III)
LGLFRFLAHRLKKLLQRQAPVSQEGQMTECSAGQTTLRLLHGDITKQAVDAIVNAANSSLLGGGGVDGAIHRYGGPAILIECREIRRTQYPDGLPIGQAVITTAGNLPAKHVIHTVGPIWRGGMQGEPALLAGAYHNSLALAVDQGVRTIAFPSISTGAYGYPLAEAATIALQTILQFLTTHPNALDEVRMVLFSDYDLTIYTQVLARLSDSSPDTPPPDPD